MSETAAIKFVAVFLCPPVSHTHTHYTTATEFRVTEKSRASQMGVGYV